MDGTVELVDAALASYAHPDLKWLVCRHVLALLHDFPSLSPSVDTYTGDDGAAAVLLNMQGLLTVSSELLPLLFTAWLPRGYPYQPPIVYVFPAPSASAILVPDHPFVDHRTGRVRRELPCLDTWSVPKSSLTGLVRSLVRALRMCHPVSVGLIQTLIKRPDDHQLQEVLVDELAARLRFDVALLQLQGMPSLHADLRARADTIDRAIYQLEEERMRLEQALTACLRHHGQLLSWLQRAADRKEAAAAAIADDATALFELQTVGEAPKWLESKASELAVDDTMDALGHGLENRTLGLNEYMKRVKILAREHFFHCYAAPNSIRKRFCSISDVPICTNNSYK